MQITLKVNTDALRLIQMLQSLNHPTASVSRVACDHIRELIEASSKCIQGTASPDFAEVMGICKALSQIKNPTGRGYVVETDSMVAVQAIRSSSIKLSLYVQAY